MRKNEITRYVVHAIYTCALTISLFACAKKDEEIGRHLDLDNPAPVKVSDVLYIDAAIPLKKDSVAFNAGLEDIYRTGDMFVARDGNRVVYLFDAKGNCISSSEKVIGHGHGEYDNMLAYGYNRYSNTVEIITPTSMKIYDLDFNFIKENEIPSHISKNGNDGCMFTEIFDLDENVHVLIPSSVSHNRNSIVVFDSKKGDILKTIDYSYDIAGLVSMQSHSFADLGGSILFYPPAISKFVYSIDKDNFTLTKEIAIDGLEYENEEFDDEWRYSDYALNSRELMPLRCMFVRDRMCFLAKEGNNLDGLSYMVSNKDGGVDRFMARENGAKTLPIVTCTDGQMIYGLCEETDLGDYYTSMNLALPDSLATYPSVILSYGLK